MHRVSTQTFVIGVRFMNNCVGERVTDRCIPPLFTTGGLEPQRGSSTDVNRADQLLLKRFFRGRDMQGSRRSLFVTCRLPAITLIEGDPRK
jgi:hypothetical protein